MPLWKLWEDSTLRDIDVSTREWERVRREPVVENWARQVSVEDLFMFLLKLTAASVPFLIAAVVIVAIARA